MVSAVLLVLEARKLEHSREVCDGKRRILVEVLRLDEALEQVPAHGGWRAGRGVLWWCWEVGMDIWLRVSAASPVGYTTMEMAMMYPT